MSVSRPVQAGGVARLSPATLPSGHSVSARCRIPASPVQWGSPSVGKQHTVPTSANGTRTLLPSVGDQHSVAVFLRRHGLGQYVEMIVQNGFDDLDTLLDIAHCDIQAIGIPNSHAVKLLDATRAARDSLGCDTPRPEGSFDEQNPVALFLKDVGLSQYAYALLHSGFDEMEILLDIEDSDMKDLGIPRGHALKLRKKIQQYTDHTVASQLPSGVSKFPSAAAPVRPAVSVLGGRYSNFLPPTEVMKTAVEVSWEQVKTVGCEVVADRLCKNFFAIVPEAIHLFPPQVLNKYRDWTAEEGSSEEAMGSAAMCKLWGKVVNVVGCSVAGLHDINRLVPMLRQLGMRHINYGPTEEYWGQAGKALNFTLHFYLGSAFTSEVEQAWTMTFSFITAVMISGLREAQAAAEAAAQQAGLAPLQPRPQDTQSEHSSGATRVPSVSDTSHDDMSMRVTSFEPKNVAAEIRPKSEGQVANDNVNQPAEDTPQSPRF